MIQARSCFSLATCLFQESKHDISRSKTIEITRDELVLRKLEVLSHLIGGIRIVCVDCFFPSNPDVSSDHFSEVIKCLQTRSLLSLADNFKLLWSHREKELDAVTSSVRADFRLTFFSVYLDLLKLLLASSKSDFVVPYLLHCPEGV